RPHGEPERSSADHRRCRVEVLVEHARHPTEQQIGDAAAADTGERRENDDAERRECRSNADERAGGRERREPDGIGELDHRVGPEATAEQSCEHERECDAGEGDGDVAGRPQCDRDAADERVAENAAAERREHAENRDAEQIEIGVGTLERAGERERHEADRVHRAEGIDHQTSVSTTGSPTATSNARSPRPRLTASSTFSWLPIVTTRSPDATCAYDRSTGAPSSLTVILSPKEPSSTSPGTFVMALP